MANERLQQQFIRVGDEVEEGLEIGLVLPLIQLVVEGAFFGIGFVFFALLDEQLGGEDLAAEVAVIECRVVDPFVEGLELGDREFGGQQFEEKGVEGCFVAQLLLSYFYHSFMIEDQLGHFLEMDPFGMVVAGDLLFVLVDVDEGEVGDADGSFYGVALGLAESAELLHVHAFEAGELFENMVGCIVEAFTVLEKAAHQAPFTFFRLEAALNEEELYVGAIESEDDTVYGYQDPGFTSVTSHAEYVFGPDPFGSGP